jgi:hypothetical protein
MNSIAGCICDENYSFLMKSSMLAHAESVHSTVKSIAEGTRYENTPLYM